MNVSRGSSAGGAGLVTTARRCRCTLRVSPSISATMRSAGITSRTMSRWRSTSTGSASQRDSAPSQRAGASSSTYSRRSRVGMSGPAAEATRLSPVTTQLLDVSRIPLGGFRHWPSRFAYGELRAIRALARSRGDTRPLDGFGIARRMSRTRRSSLCTRSPSPALPHLSKSSTGG